MMQFKFSQLLVLIGFICFSLQGQSQSTGSETRETSDEFSIFKYRNIGPTRGGRVTTVEGVELQPGTFYMGSSGGGVWKTVDYGINWNNVSDRFFITPSIGAIRAVESNPDIIYVGTGSDGIRSNVITGKGVYKSNNGGKTWKHAGLTNVGQIGAVEIHPNDPETIFVAAIGQAFQPNKERGVYRTLNGGETWEQVLYVADTIGAADLEFAPGNPEILYATMWRAERKPWTIISGGFQAGGIYKSVDGGTKWKKVTKGLPEGLIGKIDLAVSADDPKRVYAVVEAPSGEGGLYRSDDWGESFYLVSTHNGLINRPFYYCNIEANPLNANSLYSMAGGYYHSTDGGKSWRGIRAPHGDHHDLWINREDTLNLIQSNDGGANISMDGGKTWSTQQNQPTAELYQVEVDDQYPYWLYAGQQDNSTIAVPSLPPYSSPGGSSGYWLSVGGCETGPAVPKPGNHNIVYSNCKGRFGVYDKRTGQERQYYVGATNIYSHNPKDLEYRFQRVAPIHVSPHNPDVVYHGSQFLHKTTNDGITWETISSDLTAFEPDKQVISGSPITRDITGEEYYSTIYAIRESSIREGLIWVGSNDGPIHVTRDGGETWKNVTPKDIAPGGRVDCVEPSPHQEGKAYVAILRYQLGDWHPYIFKTNDYGNSWKLLTTGKNGLPDDFPTRVVREDPDVEGLLYAGTEFGLFVSLNDGQTWKKFQQNLPVTPVTDIKVFRQDLQLSTMGRSFWIVDNLFSLHQMVRPENDKKTILFQPKDTYRYRYRGTSETAVPGYPSPAVIIDYFIDKKPETKLTLEIINYNNEVIREISLDISSQTSERNQEPDMAFGFFRQRSAPKLSADKGINRFQWDMKHTGAWDPSPRRSFLGGPTVSPGKYRVRLTLDNQSYTQNFSILPDPKLDGVGIEDMKKQEELSLKVRDLLSDTKQFADQISKRRKNLALLIKEEKDKKLVKEDEELVLLESQLITASGPYMTPMLTDQINYLGSMLDRADQMPGRDAYIRYEELKKWLNKLQSSFKEISD